MSAPYTSDDDSYLIKYIATYNPLDAGRRGNALYKRLCENADGKWKWSRNHSWASWRDRYVKNSDMFDQRIKQYMVKHGIKEEKVGVFAARKRVKNDTETSGESDNGEEKETRVRKRKKVDAPSDGIRQLVKVKQEPVDNSRSEETIRKGREPGPSLKSREDGQPGQSVTAVKESENEVNVSIKKAQAEEEEESEEEGVEEGEGEGEGPDDHKAEINLNVPRIAVAGESNTDSDTEENDSEAQIDELHTPESGYKELRNDIPSIYPDINTVPSPHPREEAAALIPGTHDDSLQAPATKITYPQQTHRTNNTKLTSYAPTPLPPPSHRSRVPQLVASSSKVRLSPSHQLSRASSLFRDTRRGHETKDDEDYFVSAPATPTPELPIPIVKRKLPQLVEGPFRNAFVAGTLKGVFDSDSDEEEKGKSWPPVRKKGNVPPTRDKGKRKEQTLGETGKSRAIKELRNTRPQNRISSIKEERDTSSRRKLTPSPPKRRLPLLLKPANAESKNHPFLDTPPESITKADSKSAPLRDEPKTEYQHSHGTRDNPRGMAPRNFKKTVTPQRSSPLGSTPAQKSDTRRQLGHVNDASRIRALPTLPRSRTATSVGPPLRRNSNLRHEMKSVDHPLPQDSHIPGNPFTVSSAPLNNKKEMDRAWAPNLFNRRHTVGDISAVPSARNPKLRSHSLQQARQSLPVQTTTPQTVSERSFEPSLLRIPVAPEDQYKVNYLGISTAIGLMAKNFSIAEEVVWRAWETTKSIDMAEEFCRRLSRLNARSEAVVLEDMVSSGLILTNAPTSTPGFRPESSPAPLRRLPVERLKVKPFLDDDAISEYTPPSSTRAAQYNRLVKQGRKEEALMRERQRAGSNLSGPGRDVFSRSPLAPEMPAQSPQMPETRQSSMAPEEYIADEDSPIAPDLYDEVESHHDLYLDEEIEAAFLSADARNREDLRELEESIDPDIMVRWTVARLAQLRDETIIGD